MTSCTKSGNRKKGSPVFIKYMWYLLYVLKKKVKYCSLALELKNRWIQRLQQLFKSPVLNEINRLVNSYEKNTIAFPLYSGGY